MIRLFHRFKLPSLCDFSLYNLKRKGDDYACRQLEPGSIWFPEHIFWWMSPILQYIPGFTLTVGNIHLIPLNFFIKMESLESFTVMSHEDSKLSRERGYFWTAAVKYSLGRRLHWKDIAGERTSRWNVRQYK
jgi:hypothetical protein